MTATLQAPLRIVSFGDLDTGLWGVALDGDVHLLALGSPNRALSAFAPATIDGFGDEQEWRLTADGLELAIEPHGEAVAVALPGESAGSRDPSHGFDQLCRLRGQVESDGLRREVDCLSIRSSRGEIADLRSFDSVRGVGAWFGPDDGLAVLALRPRGAAGHDTDRVSAAVFERERSLPVTDPRLSTTYTAAGLPARVSLELWLGEGEFPRRAAGESAGPRAAGAQGGLDLQAGLFRCRSGRLEGPGVYLLARSA